MDTEAEKQRLRRALLARRRLVGRVEAEAAGRAVTRHVLAAAEFRGASRVALYAALADELPTRALFDAALARGKRVLLPRQASGGCLEFAPVGRFEDLRPGGHGVLEPPPELASEVLGPDVLTLVPGVAFDDQGHRLGRGGGWYDRTFPPGRGRQPILFGVAYALQVVAAVPHGPRDRAVEAVVTEHGVQRVDETR